MYVQKSVMCNITISTVEEKSNWWCYVCTKCHDRVKIVEDEYECAVCNRIIPYPQKRLLHLHKQYIAFI